MGNFSQLDSNLGRLFDSVLNAIKSTGGLNVADAPNAFKDRLGGVVDPGAQVEMVVRTLSASEAVASIRPLGVPCDSVSGTIDLTQLEGGIGLQEDTGTAIMVNSTIDVTVPAPEEGGPSVPVGSLVYATVSTPGGVPKLLSAVRLNDTTIRISSAGIGYGSILESAAVPGTLVAGVVTLNVANVVGDRLSVARTASAGTPGILSVRRLSDTQVEVESWLAGTGIEVLDTSDVAVYNFGQSAHETSTVRWAVIRPAA